MRDWLLGRKTWAYPWMRWLGMPLFRVGLLVLGLSLIISGHTTAVTWLGVAMMAVSLGADLINAMLVRTRAQRG